MNRFKFAKIVSYFLTVMVIFCLISSNTINFQSVTFTITFAGMALGFPYLVKYFKKFEDD